MHACLSVRVQQSCCKLGFCRLLKPPPGSVINLGTEKHRRKYLDDIDRLRLPGKVSFTPHLPLILTTAAALPPQTAMLSMNAVHVVS